MAFALVSIQWVLIGYSLAFGHDVGGFIGNLEHLGLNNVGVEPERYRDAIPGLLYMVFQLVFATVTMAIVTSGIAERVKFSAYLVFALLWTTVVYDPLAHWVWAGDGPHNWVRSILQEVPWSISARALPLWRLRL